MDNALLATFKGAVLYAKKILEKERKRGNSFNYDIKVPDNNALYSYHTWSYLEAAGMLKNEAVWMRQILFNTQDYWETIPFEENAYDVFKWMYENFDVYIATSAFLSEADECILGKVRFIENTMPWFDMKKLIYSHAKYNLKGDYIIEDVPDQIQKFGGKKIIFDRPYNRWYEEKDAIRVTNWWEIKSIFKNIL
tara:strand:+ start:945 stop:1526 length:582 start_codon:yes stop_codon:yes gene_type:complete